MNSNNIPVFKETLCDKFMRCTQSGFVILLLILISPILLLFILLSHNILNNIVFIIIVSIIQATSSTNNVFSIYVNTGYIIRNILHIILISLYRYPFSIIPLIYNLLSCISIIVLSIIYDIKYYYLIFFSIITIISEFWIKSSKKSIINCEDNLLRLLYYENYHKSYERDKYKEIDNKIVIQRKFCNGISYFDVHSTDNNNANRPNLVLIHGYYSGKIFATELIRILSRYYNLIIPDLPGNGLSNKLSWLSLILFFKLFNKSKLQIEQYIVNILNKFFIEIGIINKLNNNKKFYLLGHSFGGYISTLYTINYPNNIFNKLILLSPVAISNIDKPSNFNQYIKSNKSILGLYMRYLWCRWCSIQEITRCLGPCCSYKFVIWRLSAMKHTFFWNDINNKYKNEIMKYWLKYTYYMYLAVPISLFERLFYDFIGPYLFSYNDISNRLIKIILKYNINTLICHGDDDWVSKSGALHIYKQIKQQTQSQINMDNKDDDDNKEAMDIEQNLNVTVKIIKNGSHQMIMNQSIKISNLILIYVWKHVYFVIVINRPTYFCNCVLVTIILNTFLSFFKSFHILYILV